MEIAVTDFKGNQAPVNAYSVSVTDTINTFPTLAFSFEALGNNLVIEDMLGPDTIFEVAGQKYRLTTANPVPNARYRVYAITATHVGYDLHDVYQTATLTGSQSLAACLNLMTSGTKFTYQVAGNFNSHDFGTNTIGGGHGDDILSTIAQAWSCEYWFDNYTIHIAKTIGVDNAFLFVDRINTTHIAWTEDYSSMYTAIHGYGKQLDQSSDDTSSTTVQYSCQSDYVSPLVAKGFRKRWADAYTSDTITDVTALQAALKSNLHDYPDVQYTVDWVTFNKNAGGFVNQVKVGNHGWLRDRYGTDVNVRIQSVTRYLDNQPGNNSTITFGNKIFNETIFFGRQADASKTKEALAKLTRQYNNLQAVTTKLSTKPADLTAEEVTAIEQYYQFT